MEKNKGGKEKGSVGWELLHLKEEVYRSGEASPRDNN